MLFDGEEYLAETKKISLPRRGGGGKRGRGEILPSTWDGTRVVVEWDIKLDRERFRIIVYYPRRL